MKPSIFEWFTPAVWSDRMHKSGVASAWNAVVWNHVTRTQSFLVNSSFWALNKKSSEGLTKRVFSSYRVMEYIMREMILCILILQPVFVYRPPINHKHVFIRLRAHLVYDSCWVIMPFNCVYPYSKTERVSRKDFLIIVIVYNPNENFIMHSSNSIFVLLSPTCFFSIY